MPHQFNQETPTLQRFLQTQLNATPCNASTAIHAWNHLRTYGDKTLGRTTHPLQSSYEIGAAIQRFEIQAVKDVFNITMREGTNKALFKVKAAMNGALQAQRELINELENNAPTYKATKHSTHLEDLERIRVSKKPFRHVLSRDFTDTYIPGVDSFQVDPFDLARRSYVEASPRPEVRDGTTKINWQSRSGAQRLSNWELADHVTAPKREWSELEQYVEREEHLVDVAKQNMVDGVYWAPHMYIRDALTTPLPERFEDLSHKDKVIETSKAYLQEIGFTQHGFEDAEHAVQRTAQNIEAEHPQTGNDGVADYVAKARYGARHREELRNRVEALRDSFGLPVKADTYDSYTGLN